MQYNNNIYRKIFDVLFPKQYLPFLNVQDNIAPLKLFNCFWLCVYNIMTHVNF